MFNWFNPIETKHNTLEDKYTNFNARKILLEGKVKKLEEKVSKPININEGQDFETAAELAGNLRKLEEEVQNLEEESQNTANLYSKQQKEYQAEIEKLKTDQEKKSQIIDLAKKSIEEVNKNMSEVNDRIVFKQYYNEKYGK